jgi:hypothetical protein
MLRPSWIVPVLALACALPAHAADLCKGKKPGTVSFYAAELARDAPLPKESKVLAADGKMFALMCLISEAGPQEGGGEKFRVVLYVDGKQAGVLRPQLSKARKDIIISIDEDFWPDLKATTDAGEHEFRLQAATEKGTGKVDISVNLATDTAYIQELRKAGYVADGKIKVKVP